jgi:hypothetical protein
VAAFVELSDRLNPDMHIRYEECVHRRDAIVDNWNNLNEEFNLCNQKIQVPVLCLLHLQLQLHR